MGAMASERHGLAGGMTETLQQLRSIGRSEMEEDFRQEVGMLNAGQEYLSNTSFRNQIDKYWLAENKHWVSCFISFPDKSNHDNWIRSTRRSY